MNPMLYSVNLILDKLLKTVLLASCSVYFVIISDSTVALESVKFGVVMARGVALDPKTRQPILVEYGADGKEIGKISIPEDYQSDVENLVIMSAAEYRGHQQRLIDYQNVYANDLGDGTELLSRKAFLKSKLKAVDNITENATPVLSDSIKSVYVRTQGDQKKSSQSQLILLSFPVNLAQRELLEPGDQSLVLNQEGDVIARSKNTIAYRMGFWGDTTQNSTNDLIFGPVPGVSLRVRGNFPGGKTASDERGDYSMHYFMPLCPVNGYSWQTDVWVELYYQQFLPTGSPTFPYFERRPASDNCFASLVKPHPLAPTIYKPSLNSVPVQRKDIFVDIMFLAGRLSLQNHNNEMVGIGDVTRYRVVDKGAESIFNTRYDFNGDGNNDKMVVGKILPPTSSDISKQGGFAITLLDEAKLQGLYFSTDDMATTPPDLVRLLDVNQRNSSKKINVLKTIGRVDFRNTDIMVFRASTGELLMERQGLRNEDNYPHNQIASGNEKFNYRLMLQSPRNNATKLSDGQSNHGFSAWVTDHQLVAPYKKRKTNHLKPGEMVTVVAINRATGYMASADVQLINSGEKNNNNLLNVIVPDMVMRPPNLKIWAERQLLSSQRDSDESTITIYTDWLRHDGSPLPKQLGLDKGEQYGLSGQLAKIVTADTLLGTHSGSDLIEFAITPGRHTQVVKVTSHLSKAEHYKIQVIGKAKDQPCKRRRSCPSFGSSSDLHTPFLVPVFEEDNHWLSFNTYRAAKSTDNAVASNFMEPVNLLPSYAWQYQAQFQFSQFELELQANNQLETKHKPVNKLTNKTAIFDTDDLIRAMYSLVNHDIDKQIPEKEEQHLVFSLGSAPMNVKVRGDNFIHFENANRLDTLSPEDYLAMRLYTNNTTANILDEYAFKSNSTDKNVLTKTKNTKNGQLKRAERTSPKTIELLLETAPTDLTKSD